MTQTPNQTAQRDEFQQLSGQISRMVGQLMSRQFEQPHSIDGWCPAVNIYRLPDRIEVCVDLAGIDRRHLDVRVEPGRLTIRGHRRSPEPPQTGTQPMRIIAMEIDHGPFCRSIVLSEQLDLRRVESEYREGLLWVRLPFKTPG